MRRIKVISQRKRIFLGCEGDSEFSYGAVLNSLADDVGLRIHIDREKLQPGAGSALALVKRAAQKIKEREREYGRYAARAMMLDVADAGVVADAIALAKQNNIDILVWQDPDHEAFILRHLPGHQVKKPPAGVSMAALMKVWPSATAIKRRLSARYGPMSCWRTAMLWAKPCGWRSGARRNHCWRTVHRMTSATPR